MMKPRSFGHSTALFTDIEGSTSLLRRLSRGYDSILADHFKILRAAVKARGGVEASTEGDALFVVFADAADAIVACVEAQRALAAHAWPSGVDLRVRMGLHTGEVRLSGGEYIGLTIHQAARVVNVAHGGQIVCSPTTAAECDGRLPDGVTFVDLGRWRVRDFDGPTKLFQVASDGLALTFPALRTLPAEAHNLPLSRTSFVGREAELADLAKLLADHRLVTVLGPGGAGKTRVAFELGRGLAGEFEHGATAVLLAPLDDPNLLVERVAEALGVRDEPGHPLEETVVAALSRRRTLLILDNCEHMVDAVAALADTVLARASGVAILATSRRPLQVDGERIYRLSALEVPESSASLAALARVDSVRLFLDRARAADADLVLDANTAPAVRRICDYLEGLPLAIELAASRLRSMPVGKLAERVGRAVASADGPARTGDNRQRTVRATVDWSQRLLNAEEAIAFRRFAVFRGGCDLDAAEAVLGFEPIRTTEVVDLLDALVCHSLVQLDHRANGLYRMLAVVRDVASDHVVASGEGRELRNRHLSHYASFIEAGEGRRQGPDMVAWWDSVDLAGDNLRAALEWAMRGAEGCETGARMVAGLAAYWSRRGGPPRVFPGLGRPCPMFPAPRASASSSPQGDSRLPSPISTRRRCISRRASGSLARRVTGGSRRSLSSGWRSSRGSGVTTTSRPLDTRRHCRSLEPSVTTPARRSRWAASVGWPHVELTTTRPSRCTSAPAAIAREIGDRAGEATWIANLGIEDFYRGDYDAATRPGMSKPSSSPGKMGTVSGRGHTWETWATSWPRRAIPTVPSPTTPKRLR